MNIYRDEYLRVLRNTIDPEAEIDDDGNIVYVEQGVSGMPKVVIVQPDECREIIQEMYGGVGC